MTSHEPNANTVTKAVSDPAVLYGDPENVLNDMRLNDRDKRVILESWALDQKRLMESEDENMGQVAGGRPSAAATYQHIRTMLRFLEN